MASSGKFDPSSGSSDMLLYTAVQRGSYVAGSMDGSASFRENTENPILSYLPSMSRSTSTVTQGDVTKFLQCLRFDPKSMAAGYKFNRHGDFKRLATAALGTSDDSLPSSSKGKLLSSSSEDLKRLRAGLRESAIKARERVKIFSESLLVVNKCFPNISSRKRSRPDALSGDRANGLLADRAVTGAGIVKMGNQNLVPVNTFDFDQQKNEEKGKNTFPGKRTRTSMLDQRADVRPNTPARTSVSVVRDKEMLRSPNGKALQCEDRALPIVADGWEKAKMKRKRSVMKADAAPSPSSTSTKPVDGYREPKQGIHPKHLPDARSRLTDSYGFRAGATNGVIGAGKADGSSMQAISIGGRSSIPKLEQESAPSLHDKRERINNLEKERTNIRTVKKVGAREEFICGSLTSMKPPATTRGPRSGSSVVPKLSPMVQQSTASNDWESSHDTSKNPGAAGSINHKRTLSTRSSSPPPVAQWADRRPQKMSRTARRTNLVPVVLSNEALPALDSSDVTGSENGPGFARRFTVNSPRQSKLKGDHLLSPALSESEELGAHEFRSRDKGKKLDEVEDKAGENVKKTSTLNIPTRKNKLNVEDNVHGVRRQGRTGLGSAQFSAPMRVKKPGNVGTAKHSRLIFDKSVSKPGRPPTWKPSDRRASTRQKHTPLGSGTDFLDDRKNELLAAEGAAINPSQALSSPFWRQMEPLFAYPSDTDISYLKRQGSIQFTVTTEKPVLLDVDSSNMLPNGLKVVESSKNVTEYKNTELNPEPLPPGTPSPGDVSLCQRLLSALISEEENDELPCSGNDELKFNVYGDLERDLESKISNCRALQHDGFSACGISSTLRSCQLVHSLSDSRIISMDDSEFARQAHSSYGGLPSHPPRNSESHYGNMSMNKKLLLELQSIGLYLELVPDLAHVDGEDISTDISGLEKKHNEQVSRKTSLLDKLLKSTTDAKELQEKEFKQHSVDKLTGIAYQKYMSCWGPKAPGGKNASGKLAKQAALSFVKQTIERCQEFETTGNSHFTEPLFKEIFVSESSSHVNDAQAVSVTEAKRDKLYGNTTENVSGDDNVGRPAPTNSNGEKTTKTKLKQKTTQFSASDQHKPTTSSVPKSVENRISSVKESELETEEPLDFSHLQIPDMDILGEGDDFGSWLNINDDGLQDEDFMGLEIPMDDLTDLNLTI